MAALKPGELQRAIELLHKKDWDGAHKIVQEDEDSPLACWAHGIVHLVEGDVSNARYWYGQAGRKLPRHPVIEDELEELRKAAK